MSPLVFGCFFFQAEDGIRVLTVTGVQTCALPISAFPCRHSTAGSICWATAIIPGTESIPDTLPFGPTRFKVSRASTPVPHATSNTRSPLTTLAASATFGANCPTSAGTNSASYVFAASICDCIMGLLSGLDQRTYFPGSGGFAHGPSQALSKETRSQPAL